MSYKNTLAFLAALTIMSATGVATAYAEADETETEEAAVQAVSVEEIEEQTVGTAAVEAVKPDKVSMKSGFGYTESSVTIRWNRVNGADGYEIDRYSSTDNEWERVGTVSDGSVTSFTDEGLASGESCTYAVRAFSQSESGVIYGEWSDSFSAFSKCAKAEIDPSYTAKSNSIAFNWNSVNGADGYKIYRYNTKTGGWDRIGVVVGETSYTDKNLQADTVYRYKVQAYRVYNGANCHGDMSEQLDASTAPSAVSINSGFGYTTSTVTIRWNRVSGADGYEVYRYNNYTKKWFLLKKTDNADTLSYTDSGLTAGSGYRYIVRAYSEYNGVTSYGYFGNELNAFAKCATVKMNSSYQAKSDRITFSWNSVNGADGYKVYRYNSGTGKWDRIATVSSGVTSYTDKGHSGNSKHTYAVQAYKNYNSAQCHGDMSSPLYVQCAPSAVTINKSFSYTTNSVTFRWGKVNGADGYEVYKYNTSTGKWDKLSTINNASTTSYTDSGLTAGNSYRYIVRAFANRSGGTVYGYFGDELNAFAKCSAVTMKSDSSSTYNSVTVNWNKVNGASGYKIYRYNDSTSKWTLVGTVSGGDTTSYCNTRLKANTTYQYKVQAYRDYNGAQCHGDMSGSISVKTQALPSYVYLGVTPIYQSGYEGGLPMPLGCEACSVATVLSRQYGISCSKNTIADYYIPRVRAGQGDPNYAFWNSPYDSSPYYGVYAPPVAQAVNWYLNDIGERSNFKIDLHTDYATSNNPNGYAFERSKLDLSGVNVTSGLTIEELEQELANGHSIIVWFTSSASNPYSQITYNIARGTKYSNSGSGSYSFTWYGRQHCAVLVGYDDSTSSFIMADVGWGATKYYSYSQFAKGYNALGRQSVIVYK